MVAQALVLNESLFRGRNLKVSANPFESVISRLISCQVVPKRTNLPGMARGMRGGRGGGGMMRGGRGGYGGGFHGGRGGGYGAPRGAYRGGFRGRGRGYSPY